MFEISKVFEFSAAHSVHSQKLDSRWAGSSYPKCRRFPGHGHNYRLVVYLKSDSLNDSQMVTDFAHLKWLKEFVDDCFDHKLILGVDDPALEFFLEKIGLLKNRTLKVPFGEADFVAVNGDYKLVMRKVSEMEFSQVREFQFFTFNNYVHIEETALTDFYQRLIDGLAFFKGSPTSENLAQFFYKFVSKNVEPLGVKCSKVEIYETSTSCASYSE